MSSATSKLRVLIAGGGTGGHVFPALAIKQAIARHDPSATIWFAGTRNGLEAKVLPRSGETLKLIWISGFSRAHMTRNLLLPLKLIVSFAQSYLLLKSFKPHVVIGTGGYVMGPVLWTAQRLGIPTLLQEQNSFPGYTTRKLAPRAAVVCAGFEEVRDRLPAVRVEVTGNPLRSSFGTADRAAALRKWNLSPDRRTLLVFGGSAGAKSINEAVAGAVPQLTASCNLLWQTGRGGIPQSADKKVLDSARAAGRLTTLEFIEDMPSAYAAADLAVCRAGAMTLAELALTGLPAILIPYPFATDDHQTANACAIADRNAAVLIKDAELNPVDLSNTVHRILSAPDTVQTMSAQMKSLARPDAADRIAATAIAIARKS